MASSSAQVLVISCRLSSSALVFLMVRVFAVVMDWLADIGEGRLLHGVTSLPA
ncbi:hypothetical protein FA95DRAFT_1562205 [Auriscalpium vulgare]|uniref:Uncharacterized protein n=1 Tax=Auriscalpium vulgare TaxID=40419 RepID=A0ACB8RKJ7_9AGAM|nr:hypothetical protein FA95DRAFT_1562205 [Auriscalpium vulgare]